MSGWLRGNDRISGHGPLQIWPPQIIHEAKNGPISEDAPPVFVWNEVEQCFAIGVFDGLGGSGARVLDTADGRVTAAAHAARLAAAITISAFVECGFSVEQKRSSYSNRPTLWWSGAADLRNSLEERLQAEFKREADSLEPPVSAVRGTISRRLPTTACLVVVELDPGTTEHKVSAIWAGDSRAYIWAPQPGLIQISRDHCRVEQDAFESIRQDVPMDNFVSPDVRFRLELKEINISGPFISICCSDGAFNYFGSPMEFEEALLVSILESDGLSAMTENLALRIREKTKDDVSLILVGVSQTHWQAFVNSARRRWDRLSLLISEIQSEARRAADANRSWVSAKAEYEAASTRLEAARTRAWAEYRYEYERLQPPPQIKKSEDWR